MDDQSLKREIESALNVDPSPEFLARVRTRVAAEPEPNGGWLPRRLAFDPLWATGIAGVVALIVIPGLMRPEPAGPVSVVTQRPATTIPGPTAVIEPERAVSGVRVPPPREASADRTVQRLAPALPDVLVSVDEQRALEFVAAITSRGRVSDLSVEAAETDIEAVTLRDVEIIQITGLDPVLVRPLQIAQLEGERQ